MIFSAAKVLGDLVAQQPFERANRFENAHILDMLAVNIFVKVKPGAREELLEAVRVLFDELAKEPTFLDAWRRAMRGVPDEE